MKKRKISLKPERPVYPSPAALITSIDKDGKPNVLTLGECFNVSIRKPVIVGIAIRKATYSYSLIVERGEFGVNLPSANLIEKVDLVGTISGRKVDKFAEYGLTPFPAKHIAPPLIQECPVNLECKLWQEQEVGDHQLILGEVLAEYIDADKVDEAGNVRVEKLDFFSFLFWEYWTAGRKVGRQGFSRKKDNI